MDLSVPHITKSEIESIINQQVNNVDLYQRALVHKSIQKYITNEDQVCGYLKQSYERLELLGDAVIGLIVIDDLLEKFPDKNEGDLTKIRTRLVRGSTLSILAIKAGLKGKILMSDQVIKMNGEENKRIYEDAFEALVGALYKDKGLQCAKSFVLSLIDEYINKDILEKDDNYKDILLKYTQREHIEKPVYKLIKETGKPNNRQFTVVVLISDEVKGKGISGKKKTAEQLAAKHALDRLN